MNKQEKIFFDQYRQLHDQFYSAIRKQQAFTTIRRIYEQLQDAWNRYMSVTKGKS